MTLDELKKSCEIESSIIMVSVLGEDGRTF